MSTISSVNEGFETTIESKLAASLPFSEPDSLTHLRGDIITSAILKASVLYGLEASALV